VESRHQRLNDTHTIARAGGDANPRRQNIVKSLMRYALTAAPGAEFLNGVEIALEMVARRYAQPGTAEGSEARGQVGWSIDKVFEKRNMPYRYNESKLIWVADRGSRTTLIEPALGVLDDSRLHPNPRTRAGPSDHAHERRALDPRVCCSTQPLTATVPARQ
jgi:hypothetical protein